MIAPVRNRQPEVRNPILYLPAAQALAQLLETQPELRQTFQQLLRELSMQADQQAEKSWFSRKAPMAAYWRALAVYARHIARAIQVSSRTKKTSDQEE